ncbi:GNAT family N-acetyltransferase [Listeria grandensis]|uniref:GNAT family N-acetyltransferase n=1 Tax=Listeria grandensis TaxID=1494963 RepID=A0A7X0Y5K4_9LIST|nr:N-acetyltransferase [Listeria grandensis]MBC1937228.1 GNAT family N-acetyltransferase [Listeria grandensis]
MPQNLIISRSFKQEDAIQKLVLTAFRSKFKTTRLSEEEQLQLVHSFWQITDEDPDQKQFVALQNDQIRGTILLRSKPKKPAKPSLNFLSQCRSFGIRNTLKIMIQLLALEHTLTDNERYIDHIAVVQNAQRQGIGKALLKRAQAEISPTERLTLYVSKKNNNAIKLYKTLGFQITNQHTSLLRGLLFNEASWIFMEWRNPS